MASGRYSRERYERVFRAVDTDGSGELSYKEVEAILKKEGYSDKKCKDFFRQADISGDGNVSLTEFLKAVGVEADTKEDTLRRLFREFDKDGNGTIEKHELKEIFKEANKHFTDVELQRMIGLMDTDGDGKVDYEEFIRMFYSK